jgi:hypothetical protein
MISCGLKCYTYFLTGYFQLFDDRIIIDMHVWDYDLPEDWQPTTDAEWEWYLVRRINYGEFKGLDRKKLREHFTKIKRMLDLGKKYMLENFFKK